MNTTTFLFTDIEGSTRLWEHYPAQMQHTLAEHDRLLRDVIAAHEGSVFKTIGDAFCAAFVSADRALTAAEDAQRRLASLTVASQPLKVRMALHSGVAEQRDGDYFGAPLNRVARLLAIGHGGQVLLSQATCDALSAPHELRDLGMQRLKDLQQPEHVWQLGQTDFPPLRSLTLYDNNLPQQVTSFIGREKELGEIKEHLQATRLLSLTGSGGCGKTRLALQATAELLEHFPDGVWLVELAPLTDPDLVVATTAEVLSVHQSPGESVLTTLVKALRSKSLLLILDNCEHLLDAAARLAEALLRGCPQVKLVVSSREALGIGGELTYRVPSLSLPESARLLVERVVFHQPSFTLTEHNTPAAVALCARLDGIPLAIELAAARVRSLPIEQLAQRLDDRFRLLTGGSRTALPRQQTLRALIDWSYDLLEESQKILLCRLTVFSGGWTLEAAESICSAPSAPDNRGTIEDWEVLDLLTALTDKSLVLYDEAEPGLGRYRLLETVREYAAERLVASGEATSVRLRHRDVLTTFAEEAVTHLRSADQGPWLIRLDQELENCRQALSLALPDPEHQGLRLAVALSTYLTELRGNFSEASLWLERQQQEAASPPPALVAKAQTQLGHVYWRQGEYAAARAQLEAALPFWKAIEDSEGIRQALGGLANVIYYQGDYATAEPLYAEVLERARQSGNPQGIARALNNSALVASARDRLDEALALFEESLELRRTTGDQLGEGTVLGNLVAVYAGLNRLDEAWRTAEASLALGKELGDPLMQGYAWFGIGTLAQQEADLGRAYHAFRQSLALRHAIGERHGVLGCLEALLRLLIREGMFAEATELRGAADTLRHEMDAQVSPVDLDSDTEARRTLQEALTPERFAHHYHKGAQQPRDLLIAALSTVAAGA